MAWELLETLPQDGRRVLFTRSVDDVGAVVDPPTEPNLAQVYGWMGVDGVCVPEQVLAGEIEERWKPTHWWPDPAYDQPPS